MTVAVVVALALASGAAVGCGTEPPESSEPPEPSEERWVEVELPECAPPVASATGGTGAAAAALTLQEDAFAQAEPTPWAVWDVVAADMERDGDTDLLMNFHNRGRLELHENDGGRFTLRNPAAGDRSGLFENPGIPGLYSTVPEMSERISESGEAGVFLWHEPDRAGDWHVVVVPDEGADTGPRSASAPISLRLRANRPLRLLELPARHSTRTDEFEVRVEVAERVSFRVDVEMVATGLEVGASAPLRVGPGLVRIDSDEVTLWKDDPHGMAWADVRGDPGREIYLTRGGLMGNLQPPHAPKVDRFYEYRDGETLYADARDAVPGDYGRGRRVEWVDVDGDLVAELYVGNTDSPNVLLAAAGEGGTADGRGDPAGYRDVAPELGLDFEQGDVFTWLDVDDDGRDDLVFLGDEGFQVAFNRMPPGRAPSSREDRAGDGDETGVDPAGGGDEAGAAPSGGGAQGRAAPFDVRPGGEIGVALPPGAVDTRSDDLFANLSLYALDHDADGRLDLWISGIGPRLGNVLLHNEGGTFSDVTSRVGLAGVEDTISLIVLDVDNDRYPDALSTGETFRLLRNQAGEGFRAEVVGDGWGLPGFARGAAADFDLDCRTDVALVGDRRVLARNTGAGVGRVLLVMPRSIHGDPVGTLVRAFYGDGSVQAQRLGSAGNTQYSQGVAPLRFGIPAGTGVERLEIRWPDGRTETIVNPGGDGARSPSRFPS